MSMKKMIYKVTYLFVIFRNIFDTESFYNQNIFISFQILINIGVTMINCCMLSYNFHHNSISLWREIKHLAHSQSLTTQVNTFSSVKQQFLQHNLWFLHFSCFYVATWGLWNWTWSSNYRFRRKNAKYDTARVIYFQLAATMGPL